MNIEDYSSDIDEVMRDAHAEVKCCKTRSEILGSQKEQRELYGAETKDHGGGEACREELDVDGRDAQGRPDQYRDEYGLAELCLLHNEEFIKNAYLVLLRRQPDITEIESWQQRLTYGLLSKKDILGRLRYSREGREHNVRVKGLFSSHVVNCLCRIPLLGKVIRIVGGVARLPIVQGNMMALESSMVRLNERLATRITKLETSLELQQQLLEEKSTAIKKFEHNLNQRILQLTYMKDKVVDDVRVISNTLMEEMLAVEAGMEKAMEDSGSKLKEEIFNDLQVVDVKLLEINKHIDESRESLTRGIDAVEKLIADRIDPAITGLREEVFDNKNTIYILEQDIMDQRRHVNLLLREVREKLPEQLSGEQIRNILNEENSGS